MTETLEQFEERAEAFYRATGMLAPGKSESPAAVGQNDYDRCEVRGLLFKLWAKMEDANESLRTQLETERLRLAACGVAAMGNTEGAKAERIGPDNPYYSASYGDVCRTVDAEIALRSERDALTKRVAELEELAKAYGKMGEVMVKTNAVLAPAPAPKAKCQEEAK